MRLYDLILRCRHRKTINTLPAANESYIVSGAGSSEVNGTYVRNRTYEVGEIMFFYKLEGTDFSLSYGGVEEAYWTIDYPDGAAYATGYELDPTTATWTKVDGVNPPPTISVPQ